MKRKLYASLLIILVFHMLSGCAVFDGARMLDKEDKQTTEEVTPAPVIGGIGDTCEEAPWRITLAGKDVTKSLGTAPLDTVAPDGKILLLLYFDVTNLSDSDEYFNYMYFTAKVNGEKAEMIIPAATVINERKIALGTVASESTASYYVLYQVPENWSSFNIQYDTGGVASHVLAFFEFKA